MSDTVSGLLTLGVLIALLVAAGLPLGAWLEKTLTDTSHWSVERLVHRLVRVDASVSRFCCSRSASNSW